MPTANQPQSKTTVVDSSMSAQVDFYLLDSSDVSTRMKTVCRLSEKVQRMGHTILVLTQDSRQSKMLDTLMWTFSQSSFLPHAAVSSLSEYKSNETLQQTPVLISHQLLEEIPEVLINLRDDIPQADGLYRVLEIVDQNEQVKSSGRHKYRGYKNQQFTIKTHHLQSR